MFHVQEKPGISRGMITLAPQDSWRFQGFPVEKFDMEKIETASLLIAGYTRDRSFQSIKF